MPYTPEDIEQILKTLKIEPYRTNKVDSRQAAQILTWRSKQECGEEHQYTPLNVRSHVASGKLKPEPISERLNIYDVSDIFSLVLKPKRAAGGKQRMKKAGEKV